MLATTRLCSSKSRSFKSKAQRGAGELGSKVDALAFIRFEPIRIALGDRSKGHQNFTQMVGHRFFSSVAIAGLQHADDARVLFAAIATGPADARSSSRPPIMPTYQTEP